jgi:hypothetical protein
MLDDAGFALLPSLIRPAECEQLLQHLSKAGLDSAGTRNLLQSPWCASLARTLKNHPALCTLMPARPVAVQCTYFEKSSNRNWLVPFHQDLSIPVDRRITDPCYSGWAEKEGVMYTQPPVSVLEHVVAVRVHLDDCGPDNGPLRVLASTHKLGLIPEGDIATHRHRHAETLCVLTRGDALAMRPLLLHASSKARIPSFRRVLHFLFAPPDLPGGLRWHLAV